MSSQPVGSARTDRRSTQRERLISGMVLAARRHGYAGATVSEVIERAGVSRPTFYEYFEDRDVCFIAAHRELASLFVERIRETVEAAPPEQAVQVGLRRFIELAEEYPDGASFLCDSTMAGGWGALDARDHMIDDLARIIERSLVQAQPDALTPDVPVPVVLGALRWLLAPLFRGGDPELSALADGLTAWVESYCRPHQRHRWRTLEPGPELPPSPHESHISLRSPPAIPAGRSSLSKAEVARNQRERIIYATATVAAAKGYTVTTIADITETASVDRRVFYKHFRDKQQAFLAVHELCIQQIMAVTATAFFSVKEWPERAWASMHACAQFQAAHWLVTHIALIESHAVGAPAVQRVDHSRTVFMIFFQEGNQYLSAPAPSITMEATLGAIFETFYRQARRGASETMARLTPNGTYLMLAPFLGPEAANEFIDGKLREAATQLSSR
ncbi:MAG: TetR/AcrR family transcriptional regulator [Solirubrobacteraceae bacterium]